MKKYIALFVSFVMILAMPAVCMAASQPDFAWGKLGLHKNVKMTIHFWCKGNDPEKIAAYMYEFFPGGAFPGSGGEIVVTEGLDMFPLKRIKEELAKDKNRSLVVKYFVVDYTVTKKGKNAFGSVAYDAKVNRAVEFQPPQ